MSPARALRGALSTMGLLFAGCNHASPGMPPSCNPGEYLVSQNKQFVCTSPTLVDFPSCPDGQVLTGYGDSVGCVGLGMPIAQAEAAIAQARSSAAQLAADVGKVKTQLNTAASMFRGVTALKTSGQIVHAGADPGLASARAHCGDAFAGSHMCTVYELYTSVATGKLTAAQKVPLSWIYFPTWKPPQAAAAAPLSGLADNCGGYTYGKDNQAWTGAAVEWAPLPTGAVGFKYHGGSDVPCSGALPIACCGP